MDVGGKMHRAAQHNLRVIVELLLGLNQPQTWCPGCGMASNPPSMPEPERAAVRRLGESRYDGSPTVRAMYIRELLWERGWTFWINDPLEEVVAAIKAITAEPADARVWDTWRLGDLRLANTLCENGFRTFGDLTTVTARQLMNYPGIGKTSLDSIRHRLHDMDLWLAGDEAIEQQMKEHGGSLFSSHNAKCGQQGGV